MNVDPNKLRNARRGKLMTGKQVAQRLGISESLYFRMESGKRVLDATSAALAIGVDEKDLIDEVEEVNKLDMISIIIKMDNEKLNLLWKLMRALES